MRIILASASPRRKELFQTLFPDFEVIPAVGGESYTKTIPSEIVTQLSAQKATEIEQSVNAALSGRIHRPEYLIVGADTVVVFNDQVLGKPKDASDAKKMLRMLAGNVHEVYTGVTIILSLRGRRQYKELSECTRVRFYPVTDAEIDAYIQSGEPMDKAGSYGIQGIGGRFVQSILGDYQNVVGLPVARLYQELKAMDKDEKDEVEEKMWIPKKEADGR
ncbi:MAG: Maf family protein [Eubacterium sp.]|nr:Maf family protein [Eubacterium sp.]